MRSPAYVAVILTFTVSGCWSEGGVPPHPKIAYGKIEKDAEALLSEVGMTQRLKRDEIKIVETNYSGDEATIVLTAGSIAVEEGSTDWTLWKHRLTYRWVDNEWDLWQWTQLSSEEK
jgi:hypothetical protein